MTTPHRHVVVACFGECMLELNGTAFGTMQQRYGGDTLNTAVYLARCGAARGIGVSYATALGEDRFSTGLLQRWEAEGIDVSAVRRIAGRMPGLYIIDVDASGERSFSYWRQHSAATAYFDSVVSTPLEDAADRWHALYISGISLAIVPPAARERLFALMQTLRARGAAVVFDTNYRPQLWPDAAVARACFDRAFALASIALVTADDHWALLADAGGIDATGADNAAAAMAAAMQLPTPEIVIKCGANPTRVRAAGVADWQLVPTEAVSRVVDSTAAGDAFAAGYLSRRLTGSAAAAAAQFGNHLAARVIQHPGAVIDRSAMADLLG